MIPKITKETNFTPLSKELNIPQFPDIGDPNADPSDMTFNIAAPPGARDTEALKKKEKERKKRKEKERAEKEKRARKKAAEQERREFDQKQAERRKQRRIEEKRMAAQREAEEREGKKRRYSDLASELAGTKKAKTGVAGRKRESQTGFGDEDADVGFGDENDEPSPGFGDENDAPSPEGFDDIDKIDEISGSETEAIASEPSATNQNAWSKKNLKNISGT